MEATVDKLEAMFEKTESDLDYLSRKLDNEFSNECGDDPSKVNQGELLKKVSDIKSEFSSLMKEAEEIKKAQQDAMQFFSTQLMSACSALQKLQDQTEVPSQESTLEELQAVEKMLGLPATTESHSGLAATEVPSSSSTPQGPITGGQSTTSKASSADSGSGATVPTPSAVERRQSCSDCIDISEEEFLSVSALVRGRVKLIDVNMTLRVLWQHFKEEGNVDALSPADMHRMGLRVTGQTGQAKLKVLRSLQLLDISNSGDVILL